MYTYTDGLETARLRTRFIVPEDAEKWMEFVKDPINTTFFPNEDKLPDEEWINRWIGFSIQRYATNRYGLQALIHKETGEFIGLCGLLLQELNGVNEVEIGYHLLRRHWYKGYASEAAQMFRDYGFNTNAADSIISIIHPLNFQSKNVARKNGMTLIEQGTFFRGKEVDVFRISKREWAQLQNIKLSPDALR